jgi:hypothetical protein
MITKNNIQEYILLDADNELSIAQLQELQTYLQSDAEAMTQWRLAKDAILIADENIVLKSKINLYAIANQQIETSHSNKSHWKLVASVALIILSTIGYFINGFYKQVHVPIVKNNIKSADTVGANINIVKQDMQINVADKNNTALVNNIAKQVVKKITSVDNKLVNNEIQRNKIAQRPVMYKSILKKNNHQASSSENKGIQSVNENIEMLAITPLKMQPIASLPNSLMIFGKTNMMPMQNLKIPIALMQQNTLNDENGFFKNNKAFQFLKKVNNTLVLLNNERKNMKENGVELQIDLPQLFNKKLH